MFENELIFPQYLEWAQNPSLWGMWKETPTNFLGTFDLAMGMEFRREACEMKNGWVLDEGPYWIRVLAQLYPSPWQGVTAQSGLSGEQIGLCFTSYNNYYSNSFHWALTTWILYVLCLCFMVPQHLERWEGRYSWKLSLT